MYCCILWPLIKHTELNVIVLSSHRGCYNPKEIIITAEGITLFFLPSPKTFSCHRDEEDEEVKNREEGVRTKAARGQ